MTESTQNPYKAPVAEIGGEPAYKPAGCLVCILSFGAVMLVSVIAFFEMCTFAAMDGGERGFLSGLYAGACAGLLIIFMGAYLLYRLVPVRFSEKARHS